MSHKQDQVNLFEAYIQINEANTGVNDEWFNDPSTFKTYKKANLIRYEKTTNSGSVQILE